MGSRVPDGGGDFCGAFMGCGPKRDHRCTRPKGHKGSHRCPRWAGGHKYRKLATGERIEPCGGAR